MTSLTIHKSSKEPGCASARRTVRADTQIHMEENVGLVSRSEDIPTNWVETINKAKAARKHLDLLIGRRSKMSLGNKLTLIKRNHPQVRKQRSSSHRRAILLSNRAIRWDLGCTSQNMATPAEKKIARSETHLNEEPRGLINYDGRSVDKYKRPRSQVFLIVL